MTERKPGEPIEMSGTAAQIYEEGNNHCEFYCHAFLICPFYTFFDASSPGTVQHPNTATSEPATIFSCTAKRHGFLPSIVRAPGREPATCTLQAISTS
jgi:hypothetical protein